MNIYSCYNITDFLSIPKNQRHFILGFWCQCIWGEERIDKTDFSLIDPWAHYGRARAGACIVPPSSSCPVSRVTYRLLLDTPQHMGMDRQPGGHSSIQTAVSYRIVFSWPIFCQGVTVRNILSLFRLICVWMVNSCLSINHHINYS